MEYIIELAIVATVAGVSAMVNHFGSKFLAILNLEKYQNIFDVYVEEGADYAIGLLKDKIDIDKIEIENDLLREAVEYVNKNAPETLKNLGITEENLYQKVRAILQKKLS